MKHQRIEAPSVNTAQFLSSLTELSHKTGVAIQDGVQLYVLEPDDAQRQYQVSEDSELSFA